MQLINWSSNLYYFITISLAQVWPPLVPGMIGSQIALGSSPSNTQDTRKETQTATRGGVYHLRDQETSHGPRPVPN